jgi:hypothetical protein
LHEKPSQGAAYKRGGHKGKRKGSIAQAGGVGDEDVHDQIQGIVADPVKRVAGSVSRRAVASRQDNHANLVDDEEDEETFSTSPQVERLRYGEFKDASNDATEDRGSGVRRRQAEVGEGICGRIGLDGRLESQQEETQPYPAVSVSEWSLAKTC